MLLALVAAAGVAIAGFCVYVCARHLQTLKDLGRMKEILDEMMKSQPEDAAAPEVKP